MCSICSHFMLRWRRTFSVKKTSSCECEQNAWTVQIALVQATVCIHFEVIFKRCKVGPLLHLNSRLKGTLGCYTPPRLSLQDKASSVQDPFVLIKFDFCWGGMFSCCCSKVCEKQLHHVGLLLEKQNRMCKPKIHLLFFLNTNSWVRSVSRNVN